MKSRTPSSVPASNSKRSSRPPLGLQEEMIRSLLTGSAAGMALKLPLPLSSTQTSTITNLAACSDSCMASLMPLHEL